MRMISSVAVMQRLARRWQRGGLRVGLVPTMGFLHEGHLSLVQRARRRLGKRAQVVLSIYVNPTQFGPGEDFRRYPRDLNRDAALCRAAGVDVLFHPEDAQMYPRPDAGGFSTFVVEQDLSRPMEGSSRPTHFRGVTTIVAKLFNIVRPNLAVFGSKDYQQAAVIRRMTRDLNFPIRLEVAPTFREPDGLAMSSRNKYLEGDLRRQARVLAQSIREVQARVRRASRPLSARQLKALVGRLVRRQPSARLDYVEFFQPATLVPLATVTRGTHMAMAVFVGGTRLIDNSRL